MSAIIKPGFTENPELGPRVHRDGSDGRGIVPVFSLGYSPADSLILARILETGRSERSGRIVQGLPALPGLPVQRVAWLRLRGAVSHGSGALKKEAGHEG